MIFCQVQSLAKDEKGSQLNADTSRTELPEWRLRDHFAQHLDLIEPGLVLIEVEHRLPNEHGAGGSIDILARDRTSELVVIEIKRQDQSSRQALHELEKYVGLLAAAHGVRRDQLRAILVSTTWRELSLPFARFVSHVDFHVVGRSIVLGVDGLPTATELVELPAVPQGIEVCPIHLCLLYSSLEDRDSARVLAEEKIADLGIADFITLNFDHAGASERIIYPHSFYVVFAEFEPAMRDHLATILREEDEDGDLEDYAHEDDEDEVGSSRWFYEELAQAEVARVADPDEVAVTSPDQFTGYLNTWNATNVRGFGRYSDEAVWPEQELLARVEASGEIFSMPFDRTARSANRPAWARLRDDLVGSLAGCGDWPLIVGAVLDELAARPNCEINVHAYAIGDVIWGLEELARQGSGEFLPQLMIAWRDGTDGGIIGGGLAWDGSTQVTSLSETVGRVYPDFISYLMAHAAHATSEFETETCRLHGLEYFIVASTSIDGPPTTRLSIGDDGRLDRSPDGRRHSPQAFRESHGIYLSELMAAFDRQVLRGE